MKIATWNVNSLAVRLPQVINWLQTNPVDVLALQELKLADDKFPHAALAEVGYSAQCFGQKTYNGVALLARTAAFDVTKNIPGFADPLSRVISASFALPAPTGGGHGAALRVVGIYAPNGQAIGSNKFDYKMAWFKALHDWLQTELQQHPQLVLLGDFNITFDDADVWDPQGMQEQLHCSTQERQWLQSLLQLGLIDAFRLFEQAPKSYSWWDYRELAFRRNHGLRIDHILISQALRPHATACHIDRATRKLERPSDHAPVVLDLTAL